MAGVRYLVTSTYITKKINGKKIDFFECVVVSPSLLQGVTIHLSPPRFSLGMD